MPSDKLLGKIRRERFPLCVEKARLITESYRRTEGEPELLRQAWALEHVLENFPLWIDDDELLVGHPASKPWGVEIDPFLGPIDLTLIRQMEEEELVEVDAAEWPVIEEVAAYWKSRNWQTQTWRLAHEHLWRFLQVGIWLPPMQQREQGMGAYAGAGLGLYHGLHLAVPDYELVLQRGLEFLARQAEEEMGRVNFLDEDGVDKRLFLEAAVISLRAVIKLARRFSDLARQKASEQTDELRKAWLERIGATCQRVPALPASNFYEALQSFWFIYLVCNPSPTIGMGRFDQYMYPFYRRDKEAGRLSDEEVVDLLGELRVKDMELLRLALRPEKRMQHAGVAKWHNMVIGGLTPQGKDATNELTYLVLEAAKKVRTPHHTITLRVHEQTPEELMVKALEVVRTGLGMPAFVGDRSYIEFLLARGVPLRAARNYALGGCLDVALPGQQRITEANFFVAPKVLEILLHEGRDPRTGLDVGPFPVCLEELRSYPQFEQALKEYLRHFISLWAEATNLQAVVRNHVMKHVIEACLMADGIKTARAFLERQLPYPINSVLLPVGLINVADSLAAIRKLVYEEKRVSLRELVQALDANWEGYEELQRLCLEAPKYGNDDDYVDEIAAELYHFLAQTITQYDYVFGGKHQPGGISISSMWAGGALTGATPDGRYAGEVLADGSMSPMRGCDVTGPTAVIRSAAKIDQALYASTLLNLKFHPSALRSIEDLKKLASLIKTYFSLGGKHVQFNVVSRQTLLEAQQHPQEYRDLVVRVAGYSAYFVQLGKKVQDEIIARTELSW